MRNPAYLLVVVLTAGVFAGARGGAQAQAAPPQQPPAPAGTGLIAGQVVDADTGKPIPEVTVNLASRSIAAPAVPGGRGSAVGNATVVADSQGRFYFASLPAGVFVLNGAKPGYVRVPGASGAGTTIELVNAERMTSSVIRLLKAAALGGTLRDDAGDPIVGTEVYLLRRRVVNGRAQLGATATSTSDDRGMFRFSGVVPGDYFVCACRRELIPFDPTLLATLASQPLQLLSLAGRALSVGSDVVSLDESLKTFAPTLYPGSPTIARASVVTLASGEDRTNIDMTVPLVRAARVTGRIIGAQSAITAGAIVLVSADETAASGGAGVIPPMLLQPDGRFDFAQVPPGQYRLLVSHRETGARGGAPSGAAMQFVGARGAATPAAGRGREFGPTMPDEPPLWADELITVPDRSTVTVNVNLQRANKLSGRVELIGTPPPVPGGLLRFAVTFVDLGLAQWGQQASIAPDNRSFSVYGGPPGKYALGVNAAGGFTVKSVTIGGVDVTDLPIDAGSRDISDVVVTLSNEPRASISVTTPTPLPSQPPLDDVLLVFPADRRYWQFPSAAQTRYGAIPLTSRGTATVTNLPAGAYIVLLVPPREGGMDWQEAAKMEALSRRGQTVTLLDGEKKTIEVKR